MSRTKPSFEVGVLAGDQSRGRQLIDRLESAGVSASLADFTRRQTGILVDFETCRPGAVKGLAEHYSASVRPVFAGVGVHPGDDDLAECMDVDFPSLQSLAAARARFAFGARLKVRRIEQGLRRESLAGFGAGRLAAASDTRTILFLGSASPEFPAWSRALQTLGFEVRASLGATSAIDTLAELGCAALIIDARSPNLAAQDVCARVRRDGRLWAMPIIVLVDPACDFDTNLCDHAADIFSAELTEPQIAHRIGRIVADSRRATWRFSPPEGDARDPETGAYSRASMVSHLAAQMQRARQGDWTLSVAVVDVVAAPGADSARELARVASIARSLVRCEDMCARWSTHGIALSLPGSQASDAVTLAGRLSAVLEATVFDGPGASEAVWRINAFDGHSDPEAFLEGGGSLSKLRATLAA